MALIEELREAVVEGQAKEAVAKVEQGLAEGISANDLLQDGLIAAMRRVGELYDQGEYYVPEMLVAANAMKAALAVLKPSLVTDGVPATATIAIGTVKGDLHDVGKNLVSMMLEGAGYRIVDLGVDVPAEGFVRAIRDGADMVGMSALLTTTMPRMQENIAAIEEEGLRDAALVVVGGAPITEEYAQTIGADGFAADASAAVRMVDSLLAAAGRPKTPTRR